MQIKFMILDDVPELELRKCEAFIERYITSSVEDMHSIVVQETPQETASIPQADGY
jgi:hypothetical protein